jgi:hypothetical protein
MTLRRLAMLGGLFALAFTGQAAAQMPMMGPLPTFDNAPPAPPPGASPAQPMAAPAQPMAAPPPGARGPAPGGMAGPGAPQGEPPCFKEFMPLKQEAEKRGGLIRAAAERKAPREEVCKLFKNFSVSEAKIVKFVTENQSQCQIPPQAVTQMRANHEKTVETRDRICAAGGPVGAAPGAPPPPRAPRLSDELGLRGIAGPTAATPGRGTFDTLTGNPLAR